jgi:uncharacterized repeat protein (TIGR01451 family)
MKVRTVRKLLAPTLLLGAIGTFITAVPTGAVVKHGVTVLKGCESPTSIGQPYECGYSLLQVVTGDTATITSVVDNVAANGVPGGVSSGNILPLLTLTLTGGAACNSGQTSCTIPAGGEIDSDDYSFYTVQAADFNLPDHTLDDSVTVGFTEVCTGPGSSDCPIGPQTSNAGSSTEVQQYPTSTATTVQSGGTGVTAPLALGSSVTDQATVSGTGAGTPTGTVDFTFFANANCNGTGTSAGTGTLSSGVANSNSEGPLTAGSYSFKATYSGDANYEGSTGSCEPFTVAKATTTTLTAVQLAGTTVTSVPLGSTVTDKATVSGTGAGTPTGTVAFTFFSNGACTGTGTSAGNSKALSGGVATSNAEGPLTAGSYSFQATYSGNGNYKTSTGDCEPFTVGQGMTATTTAVKQGGSTVTSVALGSSVTDQATVTGTGAGTPTGTVSFTFFSNGACTGTGSDAGTGTLAAGIANSNSEGPLTAGAYSFSATYNGDTNYLASTGPCEPFTVGQGNSATVTTVQQGGTTVTSVALGSTVTDQATVTGTGAGTPTGTVSFTFFANGTCAGTGTSAGTGTLAAGVATSNSEGPLSAAGSYSFQATYSGDVNYLASTGACEPFTVTKGSSQTTTTVQMGGASVVSVPLGSTVTDQATVTGTGAGTPTGTVSFTFFSNGACTGTGSDAGTGTLAAGIANSNAEGPLTAGSYSFQATYNGDANYLSSTGLCEPFTVGTATTTTVTTVQLGGAAVTSAPLGSTVTDRATVSGTGAGTPTGTVSFTFFANGTCAGTGTSAGTGTLAAGVTTSSPEGPLTAGSYSFSATYNGDANYQGSTGACEPLTVPRATTSTVTTVQLAGATVTSVPLGSTVTDQATVSGTGAGTPTGTVTFTFFANGTCTGSGSPAGTGTLAAGVANSGPEGPLSGGNDSFQATYGGDTNYLGSTGACEPFVVMTGHVTVTTAIQFGGAAVTAVPVGSTVTDQATVTGSGAGTPTGSVSFTFFANATCTTPGTNAGTGTLSAGVATSNSEGPLTTGSYSFIATYSGDANYQAATGPCEPLAVQSPKLSITKTADASPVMAGNGIGFTVIVSNSADPGTATATGVTLHDPLPAGTGVNWSIGSPAYGGPGTCAISGPPPTQVLDCSFGDMAPGASASVHIKSATTVGSVGTYNNTATASATNAPSISASATIVIPPVAIPHTVLKETVSAKVVASGTAVKFTYLEKNTGTVGITNVVVTGSKCGPATFVSSSDGNTTTLDPGATWTYTCTATFTNTGTKVLKVVDAATATGKSVLTGAAAPVEKAKVKIKVTPAPPPCGISVKVSPNPLVETGASEVHGVVEVEACASFAGDAVHIDSSQLSSSCAGGVAFGTLQPGVHAPQNSIQVILDDDGNVTVSVTGFDCAPGKSVVEADLVVAPFLTATTTLVAQPPQVTPLGVTGYPANEVETGDTTASGNSDVYAVFYVETDPVYAEQTAEITSTQLLSRCIGGITWTSNLGTFHGATATATIDDDGNAVFAFTGASCAPGTSAVIADILAGSHPTYTGSYTTLPPMVTPS